MPAAWLPIEFIDAFGAGVYLLFGVLHLNLGLRRRDRPAHLWLAAACAGALAVNLTGMASRAAGGEMPPWQIALNLSGVAIATCSLFRFGAALGGPAAGRTLQILQALVLLGAPWPGILGQPRAIGPFLLFCLLLLGAALARAFAAGRAGDPESRTLARGLLVLLASLILDVLMELGMVPRISGLPVLGFTVLFLASGLALNARYDREHRELMTLRQTLEDRVDARTRDLEEANRRLADASRTDPLTGLPNRRGFVEGAERELARIRRAWRPCTLVLIDVDHIRRINETFGHATGDAVLQGVAREVRHILRGQDLVAHWSAEEFIALLPETGLDDALQAVELLRRAILSHDMGREGEQVPVTLSFGIAEHRRGHTLEGTIAEAERALIRAHEQGPNHLVVGGPRLPGQDASEGAE